MSHLNDDAMIFTLRNRCPTFFLTSFVKKSCLGLRNDYEMRKSLRYHYVIVHDS